MKQKFRQTFISNLYSIGKDSKGRILICCESGLYAYDKPDNKLTNYTSLGALPIGKVLGVAEDLQGYLWVVYPFGISRYNPQNNTAQTFYCGKDLPVNEIPLLIKQNIHFGQSTHQLYVATQDGILAFRPDLIKYNSAPPPTYLTYFKKFNQPIPFDTALFVKKKIVLQHNEAFFTIGFSALSYSNHELNKYQYQLENLDNDWTTTSQTEAKYTSVPYGKYVFRVKGCNDKGIWNATEAVLEITVLPPFWQTWLAYVLYALFLVFLIYAIVKLNTFRLQKEKLHLESIVNQRTTELKETNSELVQQKEEIQVLAEQLTIQNDRLLELDRFKQGMTSMIVHDMKNPLNMINAGLDRLDAETLKKLKNSVKHLVHLVENVLDVNRMERQKLNLSTTAVNLYRASNVAIKQIEYLSKTKFISIENEINNHHTVIANADFLERIFLNLLTNSIKYTPINGKIVLNSDIIENQYVKTSISDNGCGIPAEKIGQVFDSYFQHNPQKSGNMAATGIGLTFCKYAVLEQNGQMGAESDGANGTKFWFTLKVAETTDNQVYTNDTKSGIATFDLDSVSIPKVVINQLLEIPIFKASDIFAILVHVPTENQANKEWVEQIKNAIFTGNEKMYKHLIDSVKK